MCIPPPRLLLDNDPKIYNHTLHSRKQEMWHRPTAVSVWMCMGECYEILLSSFSGHWLEKDYVNVVNLPFDPSSLYCCIVYIFVYLYCIYLIVKLPDSPLAPHNLHLILWFPSGWCRAALLPQWAWRTLGPSWRPCLSSELLKGPWWSLAKVFRLIPNTLGFFDTSSILHLINSVLYQLNH